MREKKQENRKCNPNTMHWNVRTKVHHTYTTLASTGIRAKFTLFTAVPELQRCQTDIFDDVYTVDCASEISGS